MGTSFNPDDSVTVVSGRRVGRTGTVTELSVTGVRVHLDDTPEGAVAVFYPDELTLNLAAEGATALADAAPTALIPSFAPRSIEWPANEGRVPTIAIGGAA